MNLQTLREPRIGGFVVFDTVASIIGGIFLSNMLNTDKTITLFILFILSIILHVIFKINTHTNYLLGLSDKPEALVDTKIST